MARMVDETKIERIRQAALEMIVAKGLSDASISKIAQKAGVAEGYLYRFYKGKNELIDDLLFTNVDELANKLEGLLKEQHSVFDIIEQLIRTLFSLANHHPERIKFLYVLMNDYNFRIQDSQRDRIFQLCSGVKEKGFVLAELRQDISEEEIYLVAMTYPIQFINHRLKGFFNETTLDEPEIQKVLTICKNSLKREQI